MTIKKIFFGVLLFMLTSLSAFGQTLKSDGWEISIDKFEVQQVDFFGKKQTIYVGTLKVKKGKKKYVNYRFYLPEMDGKLSHLTIRDESDKILEPRLYFNEADKSFTFNKGTDKENKEVALKNGNTKDLILSGMLIWLKQKV